MTRIPPLDRPRPAATAAAAPHPGTSAGFTVTGPRPEPAGAMALTGLAGLIAVQDDDSPARRDRNAWRSGRRTLDALGQIQAALLGDDRNTALAALGDAVGRMTDPADPALGAITAAIRLRARVELARRGRI
ncbi:MAG TPA: flagellar assembly protein FliX [Acidiphilium sp.]